LTNSQLHKHIHRMKYFLVVIPILFFSILFSSCGNIKNLQYLQGSFDTTRLSKVQVPEPIIQKGDLLGITVYSDDPLATAAVTNPLSNNTSVPVNSMGGTNGLSSATTTSGASSLQGFAVNQAGDIQLYKLGSIPVEGKTKRQLADTLTLMYEQQGLLKNPYVEVKFLNYKVTIIGEVGKPGVYTFPVDKVNIFEAVGLAGDITVYGRRDNVLVVREINGKREFGRLNLKDPNVFLSPYYYLQQNDMLIVDVTKGKAVASDQSTMRTISIATSILSITALFITIFRK
jgi:polysaccharide export outer membrane protein